MTKSISSRQAAFLVLNSMVGVGILSLPRTLIEKADQHAWMPVFLGGVFPMLGLWLQVSLCKRHPKLDFVRLNRLLLGKVLGSVLPVLFIVYGSLVVAITSRSFNDMIMNMLFLRTPKVMLIIMLLTVAAYAVQLGVRVIARLNELLFYLVLPITLLLIPALDAAQITNILPLGEIDLKGLIAGMLSTSYSYLGFEVLMFFFWQVEEQDEVLKYSLWATIYVILQYALVVTVTLLVLGLELVRRFNYPSLAVLRVVAIPVFERMELLFVILYTALVFRPVTNYYLLVSETLCRLWGGRGMRVAPWLLLLPLSFLARWPKNAPTVEKLMQTIGKVGLVLALGVPLLLLCISLIRGGRNGTIRAEVKGHRSKKAPKS